MAKPLPGEPEPPVVNDPNIELAWAAKAHHHATIYYNLLVTQGGHALKLTPIDDEIYSEFRSAFPDLSVWDVSEDELKSYAGKEAWRTFCMRFEKRIKDFNFATLLRLNARGNYTSENTTIAPRIQFLALEIARNREGANVDLPPSFQ